MGSEMPTSGDLGTQNDPADRPECFDDIKSLAQSDFDMQKKPQKNNGEFIKLEHANASIRIKSGEASASIMDPIGIEETQTVSPITAPSPKKTAASRTESQKLEPKLGSED